MGSLIFPTPRASRRVGRVFSRSRFSLLALVALGACGTTSTETFTLPQATGLVRDVNALLDGVGDKASASSAASRLEDLARRLQEAKRQIRPLVEAGSGKPKAETAPEILAYIDATVAMIARASELRDTPGVGEVIGGPLSMLLSPPG